jgi:hypothetical protein
LDYQFGEIQGSHQQKVQDMPKLEMSTHKMMA